MTRGETATHIFNTNTDVLEEKLNKTAKDFYSMTVTVPAKYQREKEMEIFTSALRDAFRSSSRDAEKAWKTAEYMYRKKR